MMATCASIHSFARGIRSLSRINTPQTISLNAARHRHLSFATSLESLDSWIAKVQSLEEVYYDDISISKLKDLYDTLPTRADPPPAETTSITCSDTKNVIARPPRRLIFPLAQDGTHPDAVHALIYFHPRTPEALLGPDQTDSLFGPPPPFGRRMWAGGRFFWSKEGKSFGMEGSHYENLLETGRKAEARARVVSVEKKGFEKGTPMVFVKQRIAYKHAGEKRTLYEEERTHVYLPMDARADRRIARKVDGLPSPDYTFSWTPTPTTLFRFSALTWNAHLIHLDRTYARDVEGYPERLVHGPLTALLLVDVLRSAGYKGRIDNYEYRARNPVLVGQRQHLNVAFAKGGEGQKMARLWAEDDAGFVGMTATVDLLDD